METLEAPTPELTLPSKPSWKQQWPKSRVAMVAIGIACVGATVVFSPWLLQPKGQFLLNAHQYFPMHSSLYVELQPDEQDINTFFSGLDLVKDKSHRGRQAKSLDDIKSRFNQLFEPKIAIGVFAQDAESASPEREHPLAVLQLKPTTTIKAIQEQLHLEAGKVSDEKFANQSVKLITLPEDQYPGFYAITGNTLLVAERKQTLTTAFTTQQQGKNITSINNLNAQLGLLPIAREGTYFVQHQQALLEKIMGRLEQQPIKGLPAFVVTLQSISPNGVGSIILDQKNQVLQVDSVNAINFSSLKSNDLKTALENAYNNSPLANYPKLLPQNTSVAFGIQGLGGFYDVYKQFFASPRENQQISALESGVKLFGLDWRQNIIGLLDKTAAVVIMPFTKQDTTGQAALLLTSTTETQKTINSLAALATQNLQAAKTSSELNGNTLNILKGQSKPINLAYGTANDIQLFGTQKAVEALPAFGGKSLKDLPNYSQLQLSSDTNANLFLFLDIPTLIKTGYFNQYKALETMGVQQILVSGHFQQHPSVLKTQIRVKWQH